MENYEKTLDVINCALTDLKLGEKTSELELIMEKLIAEKEILIKEVNRLKIILAQIKNLIQVPKLLNHCDHAKKLDKIFINGNNFEELLKYTNFNRRYSRWNFFNLVACNNFSVLKHFIDNYEDLEMADRNDWRLIHYFCRINFDEITIYLINKCVRLDYITSNDFTPIQFACMFASFKVITHIMNRGIKLDYRCIKFKLVRE